MKTKRISKLLATALAVVLGLSTLVLPVFAASVPEATIDTSKTASLTIYKYDFTNAKKDGVWDYDSFVSTGEYESYVNETLGNATRKNGGSSSALGNSANGSSNGYAIKGVEFTVKNVAEITTFSAAVGGTNTTMVLYGFDKTDAADLLSAIGLADGAERFEDADTLDTSKYFYTADTLNKALSETNASDPTTLKNALEAFVGTSGTAMPLTDENGMSTVSGLSLGLYLVIETKVPEMVTNTTAPFFVSLPMTTVDGGSAEETNKDNGGHEWNYDVIVYPKNETGIPSLEKTVRESKDDTGKNEGSTDDITDGYDHNATGSAGDVMEYQIISTLPSITSHATSLTTYNFFDTISEGLTYNKGDVVLTFFSNKECTAQVAQWNEDSGKFTVTYSDDGRTMTIDVTTDGLAEINGDTENINGAIYTGYSNYTLRITYTATLNSAATSVLGEEGNRNEVVLTWQRTSSDYYDTLNDDCHVYTFGIDLTKLFSDKESSAADAEGLFEHVKFKIWNDTDKYWLTAELDADAGVYFATGHVENEEDATVFSPVTYGENYGRIVVRGTEDDTYILTEIETANGYTLLKDSITVVIEAMEDDGNLCDVYSKDILGVLQNDPRYSFGDGLELAGIPQKHLEHTLLTAKATVDSNDVTMNPDDDSANAFVPLTVVNRPGFDLPPTGERSMLIFTIVDASLMVASAMLIIIVAKKKKNNDA